MGGSPGCAVFFFFNFRVQCKGCSLSADVRECRMFFKGKCRMFLIIRPSRQVQNRQGPRPLQLNESVVLELPQKVRVSNAEGRGGFGLAGVIGGLKVH